MNRWEKECDDTLLKWCVCDNHGSKSWMVNLFYVPSNVLCVLCKEAIPQAHSHCGFCVKLTFIGAILPEMRI